MASIWIWGLIFSLNLINVFVGLYKLKKYPVWAGVAFLYKKWNFKRCSQRLSRRFYLDHPAWIKVLLLQIKSPSLLTSQSPFFSAHTPWWYINKALRSAARAVSHLLIMYLQFQSPGLAVKPCKIKIFVRFLPSVTESWWALLWAVAITVMLMCWV